MVATEFGNQNSKKLRFVAANITFGYIATSFLCYICTSTVTTSIAIHLPHHTGSPPSNGHQTLQKVKFHTNTHAFVAMLFNVETCLI